MDHQQLQPPHGLAKAATFAFPTAPHSELIERERAHGATPKKIRPIRPELTLRSVRYVLRGPNFGPIGVDSPATGDLPLHLRIPIDGAGCYSG